MAGKSDHDLLTELHAMCVFRCAKVEKHESTIYGNSRMGLVSRVAIMWWGLTATVSVATIVVGGLLLKHFGSL